MEAAIKRRDRTVLRITFFNSTFGGPPLLVRIRSFLEIVPLIVLADPEDITGGRFL
jgi:hypothetical protein